MRQIAIKYEGECRRCGIGLKIGQAAFYEKSMGCFCIGCEPKDTEEIRHFRKLKAEKKAERLINKAGRLEREAEQKMSAFNSFRGDTAFMTQPGHIPGRDRIIKRYDKGHELLREAQQARDRAESVKKVRVAGDAERQRERIRAAMDQRVQKGSRVYDFCFGNGLRPHMVPVLFLHRHSFLGNSQDQEHQEETCLYISVYIPQHHHRFHHRLHFLWGGLHLCQDNKSISQERNISCIPLDNPHPAVFRNHRQDKGVLSALCLPSHTSYSLPLI